ncbi:ABC transporter ATP-binding protein [Paenibacillus sp. M1]|uniref:ABC transporter ATP-binding protein n=1 Tax=Paenibacillus haidiansis TaxID=1574488 RepID=A0ABU7VTR5_9BACL
MLHLQGVKKQFQVTGKNIPILDIPEWSVGQGEKIAIIGPSGSGKSTLLHLIGGILRPDAGEIVIGEERLSGMKESRRDAFRAEHIGYILQDFHLIPSLTAKQNVEIALNGGSGTAERRDKIDHWFESVGLKDRRNHKPSQLSRGQQQRVAMIRALIHEPALVLADEPTGSLDWETADEIAGLLLELCGSDRHTLLVVTHDLKLAERFPKCVRIGEINEANRRAAELGRMAI